MELKDLSSFNKLSSVKEITGDSQTDYTLPDYQGDVRRVLLCECSVKPSSSFSASDGDEFSGIVCYDVLYLDSDGELTHAAFNSDYDIKLKNGDTERVSAYPNISIGSFSVRLTGPRKFSAKAVVCASIKCISEDEIKLSGTAFDGELAPETLESVLKIRSATRTESVEREYAERLERLDGQIADEIEILHSGAEIVIDEAVPNEESATLKGKLRMYALVKNGEMPVYLIEKEIPVEESVPFPEIKSDMMLVPSADIVSTVAVVNADDEGAEIVLNVIAEYDVLGDYNQSVTAVTDGYLVGKETVCGYSDYRYTELVDEIKINENISCELAASDITAEKIREMPYLSGVLKINDAEVIDGHVKIAGELRAVGLCSVTDTNGEISYTGIKLTAPLDKQFKIAEKNLGEAAVECMLDCANLSCVVDTDTVEINYKLTGCIAVTEQKNISVLSSLDTADNTGEDVPDGTITVYYPTNGDSLFGVAKRFRVESARIAQINSLSATVSADGSDTTLNGVERLYIY